MSRSRSLKFALSACLASAILWPAILPEQIGAARKGAMGEPAPFDAELSQELGFERAEEASYAGPAGAAFKVAAWRFKDPTSAYAFHLIRKSEAPGAFLRHGNYVLEFSGATVSEADRQAAAAKLPKLDQSGVPGLDRYLPRAGLVAGTERYVIGPVGLQRFESRIPPGAASFSFGAEALTARYLDGSTLTIFNYPVPSMARDRVDEFRKIPGAVAKRAGPMAAVVLGAPNPEASERLLGQVAYQAQVTWNEPAPGQEMRAMAHGIVTMILLAFAICGMCILGGLVVGGFLVFRRRSSKGQHDQALTTLGLG